MPDSIRGCQWGAFDVANYCDRLFPLIARDQLASRLPNLELVCHAPLGHADLPPGSPRCYRWFPAADPSRRREYFARHFDAVLIGGDLLRFDASEPHHDVPTRAGTTRPYAAFLDYLWGEDRPTILWNASGATFPFEPSRLPLVRRALSNVTYAAVRDEVSRGYLLEAGVEVIPRKESLEERLKDIESSTTWRLFGPYRRPRPIVDALIKARSEDARGNGSAGPR